MFKNRIIVLILALMFSMPVFSTQGSSYFTDLEPVETPITAETTPVETEDVKMPELPNKELYIPHKQPISKKKLAKKFLLAMLCVGLCSLVLYVGLSVYNKIREGFISSLPQMPDARTVLNESDTISEAVRTFLEKTKWD